MVSWSQYSPLIGAGGGAGAGLLPVAALLAPARPRGGPHCRHQLSVVPADQPWQQLLFTFLFKYDTGLKSGQDAAADCTGHLTAGVSAASLGVLGLLYTDSASLLLAAAMILAAAGSRS